MERRYNIVDAEDLTMAKALLEKRMKDSETVTQTVTTAGKSGIPGDTAPAEKTGT
jgi:hypothetical protein